MKLYQIHFQEDNNIAYSFKFDDLLRVVKKKLLTELLLILNFLVSTVNRGEIISNAFSGRR